MNTNSIPQEMRALVLDGRGFEHLEVRRVPVPHPGPRQMLARVDAAGICTSLLKLIDQGSDHELLSGWDVTRYPLILGDEGAVTLVQIGEELRDQYRSGARYVIQPAVDTTPINHRERYRDNGRGVNKIAVGYTLAGHLAEYILITEEILAANCLLPVPDQNLSSAHAAMGEPISCVISAQDHHVHLVQSVNLKPREVMKGLKRDGVTVIVGAGAMGRMHVDLALSYHPRALVVSDFIEERLERTRGLFSARAEALGIDLHTVNANSQDVRQVVAELTNDRGADDVIVAVGARAAVENAQGLVGRGGVLNLFGGLKKSDSLVALDSTVIHYKEINVTGSSGGSPWDVARTLELMASGEINPGVHITRIGDLEHAPQFLQMVKAQEIDGKAVVYPHRRTDTILAVDQWTAEDEQAYIRGEGN